MIDYHYFIALCKILFCLKKLYCLFVLLVVNLSGNAQDFLTNYDLQQRLYSLPYYSYGKGLGFTSPDSLYQMNIRFRIQSRATYLQNYDQVRSIDGNIRRTRLRFDGYVGNPRFTYALQLSFAPGDLGGSAKEGENIQIIRDAVFFYSITNKWSVGFGQTKLPGNRQRVNSSGALQLSDRSINNAYFNIDRDFGLHFNYINQKKEDFSYSFKGAITQGEGRNFTSNDDTHLAYTGKVELYPMGAFKKNGEYFEGDIQRETKPKLLLSLAYQHNQKAKKSQGQLGEYLYQAKDINTLFADVMFKYNGFSTFGAYMRRSAPDGAIATDLADVNKVNYVASGQGVDLQSSYLFRSKYELIARYSHLAVSPEIKQFRPDDSQYTIGVTMYIWEHVFKLQSELTYNTQHFVDHTKKNAWYVRFQVEIGI